MKNSRLFKMLVLTLALQSVSQVMSINVTRQDGETGDCWSDLSEQWKKTKTPELAAKILRYYNEETSGLSKAYFNNNFNLEEVQSVANQSKLALVVYKSKNAMANLNNLYSQIKSGLSNRKVQVGIGTVLTVAGIIAAYRNREALKANASKAGNFLKDKGSKLVGVTSSAASSTKQYVGNAASKPANLMKNAYNWLKAKKPAVSSASKIVNTVADKAATNALPSNS